MVLQVRFAGKAGRLLDERRRGEKSRSRAGKRRSADEGYTKRQPSTAAVHSDSEEEDDEMSYFTSTVPETRQYDSRAESPARRSGSSRGSDSRSRRRRSGGPQEEPQYLSHKLELRRPDSLTEVISQLWTREGAWGIWKGTNVTFLHNLLLRTIETWMRGMLCAVVNLPDPSPGTVGVGGVVGGLDILDSPSPMASLGVTVAAAGLAGLVLVPLDVARTRYVLLQVTYPRTIILIIIQGHAHIDNTTPSLDPPPPPHPPQLDLPTLTRSPQPPPRHPPHLHLHFHPPLPPRKPSRRPHHLPSLLQRRYLPLLHPRALRKTTGRDGAPPRTDGLYHHFITGDHTKTTPTPRRPRTRRRPLPPALRHRRRHWPLHRHLQHHVEDRP